jgi:hypothetical protein
VHGGAAFSADVAVATAGRTERRLPSLSQLDNCRANFLADGVKKLAPLLASNELGGQN